MMNIFRKVQQKSSKYWQNSSYESSSDWWRAERVFEFFFYFFNTPACLLIVFCVSSIAFSMNFTSRCILNQYFNSFFIFSILQQVYQLFSVYLQLLLRLH